MPTTIKDENGEEVTYYTEEDIAEERAKIEEDFEGKLKEKDEYIKEKLDQFVQGKKKAEETMTEAEKRDAEWQEKLEEAKKEVEQVKQMSQQERDSRLNDLKTVMFEQYGGSDEDVRKKLDEAYEIINIEATDAEGVRKRVEAAARYAGVSSDTSGSQDDGGYQVGGGFSRGRAPEFDKRSEDEKQADYSQFKSALNLELPDNNQQ